jgi:hypothetical protein
MGVPLNDPHRLEGVRRLRDSARGERMRTLRDALPDSTLVAPTEGARIRRARRRRWGCARSR